MQNMNIEATKDCPKIELNYDDKSIKISGKSYPEDSFEFYKPILLWVKDLISSYSSQKSIKVILDIIYMNSSSFKVFFDFFDMILDGQEKGIHFDIEWHYMEENDVMGETGEDFCEDFEDLEIKLIVDK